MNDQPFERTPLQKIERLCFFLGILFFFSYLLISIINSVIFYTAHDDFRPLLTSTVGRIFVPDYVTYLSLTTMNTPNLYKEDIDGIKFSWFFSLFYEIAVLFGSFIFFVIILPRRQTISIKAGLAFFVLFFLLLSIGEIIYVFLISDGKIIIPWIGLVRSFSPYAITQFLTVGGDRSIEQTILQQTNRTIII